MIEVTLQTQNLKQVIKKLRRMQRDINRTFIKEFRREALRVLRPVGRRAIQRIRTRAPVDSGYYRKSWKMRVLKVREGRREARQFLNSRIRLLKRRWRGY